MDVSEIYYLGGRDLRYLIRDALTVVRDSQSRGAFRDVWDIRVIALEVLSE